MRRVSRESYAAQTAQAKKNIPNYKWCSLSFALALSPATYLA